jgi:hypothetical protein
MGDKGDRSQGCKVPMRFKSPYCKRLQGAADVLLYFKCPTTMQMRWPVKARR